jgi:hypothetical protein
MGVATLNHWNHRRVEIGAKPGGLGGPAKEGVNKTSNDTRMPFVYSDFPVKVFFEDDSGKWSHVPENITSVIYIKGLDGDSTLGELKEQIRAFAERKGYKNITSIYRLGEQSLSNDTKLKNMGDLHRQFDFIFKGTAPFTGAGAGAYGGSRRRRNTRSRRRRSLRRSRA